MLKKLTSAVFARVVLSYKSTLIALGIGVVVIVIDQVAVVAGSSESQALKALASIIVLVGASLKSKALPPSTP